jgi:hypothetical protein
MKNIIPLLLLLSFVMVQAQDKLILTGNPGTYLYNSENSFKTIGSSHADWLPGGSIIYQHDNLWGMNLQFEYNYACTTLTNVLTFFQTDINTGTIANTFGADLILEHHQFDLGLVLHINNYFSITGGPTIGFVNRTIQLTMPLSSEESYKNHLEDRLASVCLGANASLNLEVPLQDSEHYFFFFTSVKYRYLHSAWFDARGRNLDNYYQDFLTGQSNIGIGYNF